MQINRLKKLILVFPVLLLLVFTFSFDVSFAQTLESGEACNFPADCLSGRCVETSPGNKVCADAVGEVTGTTISFGPETSTKTFSDLLCNITSFLSGTIVPPVAVLMTLVVGFLYMISRGDPERVKVANKLLAFTILGIVVVLISPALVALFADLVGASVTIEACSSAGSSVNVITDTIISLINWLAWFIAVAAVAVGLYSGFLFITSSGDSERLQRAWKVFVFAIIGVAVATLAFSIVSIAEIFVK